MKKVYIVKKMLHERKAICCYDDKELKELFWGIYIDDKCKENMAEVLIDKLYELKRNNYKIEFVGGF